MASRAPQYRCTREVKPGEIARHKLTVSSCTMVATNGAASDNKKFLIFGKTGWIGGLLGDLLKEQGGQSLVCI